MNQDYHEALETLLARLASARATILGISVDSSVAHALDESARELELDFPIPLDDKTNAYELRLQITRAQKSIARRPTAQPGGGNDQKRIRLTISLAGKPPPLEAFANSLVGPPNAHRARAGHPGHHVPESDGTAIRDPRAGGREVRTPQETFNTPILLALESLGGSGSTQHVVDVVGSYMGEMLTDADLRSLPGGETRWRNTTRWARKGLVDAGLLSASSPRGLWKLTDAGRQHLARMHEMP